MDDVLCYDGPEEVTASQEHYQLASDGTCLLHPGTERDIEEERNKAALLQERLDNLVRLERDHNELHVQGQYDTLKRQCEVQEQEMTSLVQQLTTAQSEVHGLKEQLRQQTTLTSDVTALKRQLDRAVRAGEDLRTQVHVLTCTCITMAAIFSALFKKWLLW